MTAPHAPAPTPIGEPPLPPLPPVPGIVPPGISGASPGSPVPPMPPGALSGQACRPGTIAPGAASATDPAPMSPLVPPVLLHDAGLAGAVQHGAGLVGAMPSSLAGLLPPPPIGSYPVMASAPARVASPALAGFEDNPYSLQRHSHVGPPPTRQRARHPLRTATILLVLAVAGGILGYRLVHPSAHRSPTTVAVAFYSALASGNAVAAAADVEPQQQSAAAGAMQLPAVRQFVQQTLNGYVADPGTSQPAGPETSVTPQLCGRNLSCSPGPSVPTVKVAGAWYVDWNSWLQSLPPSLLGPAG